MKRDLIQIDETAIIKNVYKRDHRMNLEEFGGCSKRFKFLVKLGRNKIYLYHSLYSRERFREESDENHRIFLDH